MTSAYNLDHLELAINYLKRLRTTRNPEERKRLLEWAQGHIQKLLEQSERSNGTPSK